MGDKGLVCVFVCVLICVTYFLGPFLVFTLPLRPKTGHNMVELHSGLGIRFRTKMLIELKLGVGLGMYCGG